MSAIPVVALGSQGLEVSALGLGCMSMTESFYGSQKPEAEMIELIRYAVEQGITFLDTANFYGHHTNEILLAKALKGIRHKVGITIPDGVIRGDPEYVRSACEGSLKRLNVDYIDLYYQHLVDPKVPIEITVGAMKKLVKEGKVKPGLIRRVCCRHSSGTRCASHNSRRSGIFSLESELRIGIVPFSVLGRGFFAGYKPETAPENDRRRLYPRMQVENLVKNEQFREKILKIAEKKNCSLNQLALAWALHKGQDMVPIPGTTKRVNLDSNIGELSVSLTKDEMEELEAVVSVDKVAGERYPQAYTMTTYHFVTTPPLSSWIPPSA